MRWTSRLLTLALPAACLVAVPTAAHAAPVAGSPIVDAAACSQNPLPRTDDESSAEVTLPFAVDFYGRTQDRVFVNNNGNITFENPTSAFDLPLAEAGAPIIAPFLADVDTRPEESGVAAYGWGDTIYEGRRAFCVNWLDVGYYSENADKLNSFQLLLVDRGDRARGAFDIVFNYGSITWESGDLSGGEGGLGGDTARAGFSDGSDRPGASFEIAGSGEAGAFLDANPEGLANRSTNSTVPGRHVFAAPSASTERIVFSSTRGGNTDLYSVRPDGSDEVRLTTGSGADTTPSVSPEGDTVVFSSTSGGDADLYLVGIDGRGLTRLTSGPAQDTTPSFSSDGYTIAYASTRDGVSDIHLTTVEGYELGPVTDDPAVDAAPSFSPDGLDVVYTSLRGGRTDVFVVPVYDDGSGPRQLTSGAVAGFDPSYSPDGERVVFSGISATGVDLYSTSPAGGGLTRLTTDPANDVTADHSPDGSRIVFASSRTGRSDLYTMAPDGSDVRRVTRSSAPETEPSW